MLRKIKISIAIIILFTTLMILFSPYKQHKGYAYNLVKTDIIINAALPKVFSYLGNSANASKWSTFVNHITPINTAVIPDGQVGSVRRCFKNKNEKGIVWDETIIARTENKQRTINIFNAKGFPIFSENLATQQLYTAVDSNTTLLSFTLFFNKPNATWWDILKMHFASYIVQYIYINNLNNIKKYNEQ